MLVARLNDDVTTARAGRPTVKILTDKLIEAQTEREDMTTAISINKFRAEEMQTKFDRLTERYTANQITLTQTSESLHVAREVCRNRERRALCADETIAKLQAEKLNMQTEMKAEKLKTSSAFEEMQVKLTTKVDELKCLRMSVAKSNYWKEKREVPDLLVKSYGNKDGWDWYDEDLENTTPNLLSPASKQRRERMLRKKRVREVSEHDALYEAIGEGRDPSVLAKVLEATDSIDALMDTYEFWLRRIEQGKTLISTINGDWDANLSARIKADYLLSDRDLQAMRVDWSCTLVNNNPVPKVLLANPFKMYDPKQRVLYPEPVTKKSRGGGWADVIKAQTDRFGLMRNPDHVDATERDFVSVVQQMIDRDEPLLPTLDELGGELTAVVGFDGAADFCHACVRLIDYKDGVCKESAMKGVGLTVAVGDDHNFNLNLQFRRIGPSINETIRTGGTFTLRGEPVVLKIATCLDYSASRSMYGMRSNSSPHSLKLHPHLIIEMPDDSSWAKIDTEINTKMPWCSSPADGKLCNHHLFTTFPARCSRCTYTVGSQIEQDANIATALALRSIKTKAGKAVWAKLVKIHCEAHDEHMPFESAVLHVHPSDNIVDLLHAIHINIPDRIADFSFHDAVNFADDPELKHALTAYYTTINCPFDLNGEKSWWHGAVWCYDFVMGVVKESPGLDINILVCCLIVYGTRTSAPESVKAPAPPPSVVDDLPGSSAPKKKKSKQKAQVLDPLMLILQPLFGTNAEKVRSIFESWTAYAKVFEAIHDKWESSSTEYKEERASRLYRAGIACLLTPPHPDVVLGCDRAPSRKRGCARVNLPAFGWNGCPPSDLPIPIRSPTPDPIPIRRSSPAQGRQDYVQRSLRLALPPACRVRRTSSDGEAR